ncbi:MAG: molybdopterin-dependent oxidoreductase [Dehalococcoidia bacterium]|nr:molybdopterin-dependent oxidoreductase [Dehalococcoidia bacterium]
MATITLNGREIEAPVGAPLVEVIKNAGVFISNLCYIDDLPPYAGCRTCLVEIEGAPGLHLSCTAKVIDGMVVRTDSAQAAAARQAVLSLILSYHSDRCLTCHRVVKCKPGDTCLRDSVVTHRCITCSKNYRCELQTTCEMVEMAGYEPWEGEERTYYELEQPEADHANPFLEFDPKMCILCTRCVRACDQLRHTGAITLAGRGFSTRIEFGAGGAVDESNCDFCGACIDLCPTATLMEHPNKWAATETERWVPTTCTSCSVGCSISLGVRKGRGVIVRPDATANPVSHKQLCVRGRFHYDAVKPAERLSQPLVRRNGGQDSASWDEALELTAARLAEVREKHGPQAIGFLASPFATNEENYLLQTVARAVVGTSNVDSSAGPVARAACESMRRAFGSEVLPADMTQLARSKTLLVIAEDLESSHNVACLRCKDAVVNNSARLIVVSARRGELCDFADVWLRPRPGEEAAVVAALAEALQGKAGAGELSPAVAEALPAAIELITAPRDDETHRPLSVVQAVPHLGAAEAGAITAAAANLAIAALGPDAARSLFVLPQEANVWGMRDVGATGEYLPGYRPADDEAARKAVEQAWGAPVPTSAGLTFEQMVSNGKLKALVVLNDNPLFFAPAKPRVRESLAGLEFLAVIDSLPTDTAGVAHVVLPDTGAFGKEGTVTSADRRVLRLHAATSPQGEAQPAWRILSEIGSRLARRLNTGELRLNYAGPSEIMDEIAQLAPLYASATYKEMEPGAQSAFGGPNGLGPSKTELQPVPATPATADGYLLTTGRGLYTSYEGAAVHSPEADRLHREEFVEVNPADAKELGVSDGAAVTLKANGSELTLRARVTAAVQPRMLYVPLYFDGGAVTALFADGQATAPVEVVSGGR